MRSATPQLSRKVAGETVLDVQKIRANAIISIRPKRITAALVLSPKPRPSQKPAPTATMFWKEITYPSFPVLSGLLKWHLVHVRPSTDGFSNWPCLEKSVEGTFKAPQISTTSDSSTTVTRKFVVCMSSFSSGPCSLLLQPEWFDTD